MTWISRSRGSSPRRARSCGSGMLTAPGTLSTTSSAGWRTSSRNAPSMRVPVHERHVAAQDVGGDHAGEVDRILGAAELRRVAELRLLEVVDRRAHLEGHGQRADPLVHRRAVLAERLRAEQRAVRLAEDHLQPEHLRARVVAGVRVREEVDLLVVGVAERAERLLADAGPGGGAAEQADDRGALGAAEARVAPGDHVGRDPALPVGRARPARPGSTGRSRSPSPRWHRRPRRCRDRSCASGRRRGCRRARRSRGRPTSPASCPAARRARG